MCNNGSILQETVGMWTTKTARRGLQAALRGKRRHGGNSVREASSGRSRRRVTTEG